VYSIKNNKWLVKPEKQEVNVTDPAIQKKVDHYAEIIDTLINSAAQDQSFEKLKEKLRDMRSAALKQAGEFSFENLVFKELRNQGHLDRMSKYLRSSQDRRLSI